MILKPIVNVDAFRQYYQDAVNCKTELNTNADTLALKMNADLKRYCRYMMLTVWKW